MMRRLFVAALLGVGASLLALTPLVASPRQAAKTQRLSVLDYYFLLPGIGNSGYPMRRERQDLLKPDSEVGPIIDLRHDYMSVQPDSSPREHIAIFRGAGSDVIAQSAPDSKSDYNSFALYRLQNGKLRDATKQLLPIPARTNAFLYELPRVGTTIRVFSFDFVKQTRKPAFNLKWRQGRFVRLSLTSTKR